MRYTVTAPDNDQTLATVDLLGNGGESRWRVDLASGGSVDLGKARVRVEADRLEVATEDGARYVFPIVRRASDGSVTVATALGNFRLHAARGATAEAGGIRGKGARAIKSSMPGKVVRVLCAAGDAIEAGQPLMIIEAMKMENEIRSPAAGVVQEIPVQPGTSVQSGDLLVKLGEKSGG
jgi:biotin carboxyl carrier protein